MKFVKFKEDIELEVINLAELSKKSEKFFKTTKYFVTSIQTGIISTQTAIYFGDNRAILNAGVQNITFEVYEKLSASDFYSKIAQYLIAAENCQKSDNKEWAHNHCCHIEDLVENYLPSGSGFDVGTKFLFEDSNENKLVFSTSYHHMNANGYYDGWSHHKIIVRPDLSFGFDIKITGKDRNCIKDYIIDCFCNFEYFVKI